METFEFVFVNYIEKYKKKFENIHNWYIKVK